MGWDSLDLGSLPDPGDIVWCKWPYRDNPGSPGPVARPALVRAVFTRNDSETGVTFGSLEVSYGKGVFTDAQSEMDLVIKDKEAVARCGLHKRTRFALDRGNRKHLLWCREFFIPPDYLRERGLRIGRLGEAEIAQMRQCLIRRGLLAD